MKSTPQPSPQLPAPEQVRQREQYERCRERGQRAVEHGHWEEARGHFEEALGRARALGDPATEDRAFCNLAVVRIELGERDGVLPDLRKLLMRSNDPATAYLAAYNVARAYELEKRYDKGLFYARQALDRACQLKNPAWEASAHNFVGNLFLAQSQVSEAIQQYEAALERIDGKPGIPLGRVLDNLGYCRALQGRQQESFSFLYRSWRILRRYRAREAMVSLHLDLAFTHLEVDRARTALRHAAAAYRLAGQLGDRQGTKNALFLLGESANMVGRIEEARYYFSELQEFYPELPSVTDLLFYVDVRKMINLRA